MQKFSLSFASTLVEGESKRCPRLPSFACDCARRKRIFDCDLYLAEQNLYPKSATIYLKVRHNLFEFVDFVTKKRPRADLEWIFKSKHQQATI